MLEQNTTVSERIYEKVCWCERAKNTRDENNPYRCSSTFNIGLVIYLIYLLIDCRYLVTEGQIFVVYFIAFIAMIGYMIYKKTKQNCQLDANGLFLLYSFALCFVLVIIWVMYLWNDEALRLKYPGLLYIPEPWSYYTLYIRK